MDDVAVELPASERGANDGLGAQESVSEVVGEVFSGYACTSIEVSASGERARAQKEESLRDSRRDETRRDCETDGERVFVFLRDVARKDPSRRHRRGGFVGEHRSSAGQISSLRRVGRRVRGEWKTQSTPARRHLVRMPKTLRIRAGWKAIGFHDWRRRRGG